MRLYVLLKSVLLGLICFNLQMCLIYLRTDVICLYDVTVRFFVSWYLLVITHEVFSKHVSFEVNFLTLNYLFRLIAFKLYML